MTNEADFDTQRRFNSSGQSGDTMTNEADFDAPSLYRTYLSVAFCVGLFVTTPVLTAYTKLDLAAGRLHPYTALIFSRFLYWSVCYLTCVDGLHQIRPCSRPAPSLYRTYLQSLFVSPAGSTLIPHLSSVAFCVGLFVTTPVLTAYTKLNLAAGRLHPYTALIFSRFLCRSVCYHTCVDGLHQIKPRSRPAPSLYRTYLQSLFVSDSQPAGSILIPHLSSVAFCVGLFVTTPVLTACYTKVGLAAGRLHPYTALIFSRFLCRSVCYHTCVDGLHHSRPRSRPAPSLYRTYLSVAFVSDSQPAGSILIPHLSSVAFCVGLFVTTPVLTAYTIVDLAAGRLHPYTALIFQSLCVGLFVTTPSAPSLYRTYLQSLFVSDSQPAGSILIPHLSSVAFCVGLFVTTPMLTAYTIVDLAAGRLHPYTALIFQSLFVSPAGSILIPHLSSVAFCVGLFVTTPVLTAYTLTPK
ncbi:hypothetical protein J6590_013772 [Homalodisca vitripennis]|nr:hypothetical protein J6590_013772 [Homalodisca vitripennis]